VISSALLRDVFGVARTVQHRPDGRPFVLPHPE
jgi:hypothetical protein